MLTWFLMKLKLFLLQIKEENTVCSLRQKIGQVQSIANIGGLSNCDPLILLHVFSFFFFEGIFSPMQWNYGDMFVIIKWDLSCNSLLVAVPVVNEKGRGREKLLDSLLPLARVRSEFSHAGPGSPSDQSSVRPRQTHVYFITTAVQHGWNQDWWQIFHVKM